MSAQQEILIFAGRSTHRGIKRSTVGAVIWLDRRYSKSSFDGRRLVSVHQIKFFRVHPNKPALVVQQVILSAVWTVNGFADFNGAKEQFLSILTFADLCGLCVNPPAIFIEAATVIAIERESYFSKLY